MARRHPPQDREKLMALQGENLRRLRAVQDVTQASAATSLGVARPTYCRLEHGHRLATLETALRLARLFQVHVEDIYR